MSVLEQVDLSDDDLEAARRLIGSDIRIELWCHEATRDTIRRYAWGIGDDNPLYCDPDHAARSRWGTIIAPPTFYYAVFDAVVAPGLPDVQWFYAGANWRFFKPARRGDAFDVRASCVDARSVAGEQVRRMILQTGRVEYFDQTGDLQASVLSHCFRVPRSNARGGLRYAPRAEHAYSPAELDDIRMRQVNEFVRGADTLFFEDVERGTELPETVRGPLVQMDMTAYYAGAVGTSGYKSTKLKWKYHHWAHTAPERLPNNYDRSYFGARVLPSIGHQDKQVAVSELGMPGPYDNGPQRMGMMATCVTNWMGDDGLLCEYDVRLHRPVIFGDCTITRGTVIGKRTVDGRGLVEIRLRAENQLGEVTASGRAEVALPLRARAA